ncbi:MAG: AraC family transcriptional regulator [Kiritimatiellae bacterium]|nr:AraC family transcriptional regulator [Kiritimatiellia bacterium]
MKSKLFKEPSAYPFPELPLRVYWERGKVQVKTRLAYHPEYEFHLIKQGSGKYIVDGNTYYFKAGHLVVIKPNQVHTRFFKRGQILERGRMHFLGSKWQAALLQELDFDRGLPNLISLSDAQALRIEMIIRLILEEYNRQATGWTHVVAGLLREFIIWVHRVKHQEVKPIKERPVFTQLRQYVEAHFADPECNVTAIARNFGYSLNHITELSKAMSGMGLKQYLQQYRIIAARRALESDSNLKVESVARQVGFNQYRNFTREFMKQTGMRASGYREFYHQHCDK